MATNTVITSDEVIAVGNTVYGQVVRVTETTYAPPLPGTGEKAFSVSVSSVHNRPGITAGFTSVEDVKRFLHEFGEADFSGHDVNGNEVTETRQCLGIPRGMISDFGVDDTDPSTDV